MSPTHSRPDNAARIEMHRLFWERGSQPWPIAAFRIEPHQFTAFHYQPGETLLKTHKVITPDLLEVEAYLSDYERMFQDAEALGQDAFWTADPFTAIPWIEAILGCRVTATDSSFVSEPCMKSPEEMDRIKIDPDNPWLAKYLEFTDMLVEAGRGRFPVGQPILRGPSDVASALLGQTDMILALYDEPEIMKEFLLRTGTALARLTEIQADRIPPFHGGSALGNYHVYCPGKGCWYQEDASALMSPELYRQFLREPERIICSGYDQTAIHLHPTSFFIVDDLLENDWLKAIEVNKDTGGPTIEETIPVFKKILTRKSLIIQGIIDMDDLRCLQANLPPDGLFIQIVVPSRDEAGEMLDFIRAW